MKHKEIKRLVAGIEERELQVTIDSILPSPELWELRLMMSASASSSTSPYGASNFFQEVLFGLSELI